MDDVVPEEEGGREEVEIEFVVKSLRLPARIRTHAPRFNGRCPGRSNMQEGPRKPLGPEIKAWKVYLHLCKSFIRENGYMELKTSSPVQAINGHGKPQPSKEPSL